MLGKRNVSRAWGLALKRVEAPHVTLYSLRSFAVTQMIESGKDRGLTAALVGHSSESVTARYYEVVRESRLADEMRRRG
jgi:integrase